MLHVKWKGGVVDLVLGRDAEKWALKIRYPRGRLDKLGIKPQMRVAVVGLDDAEFLAELRERTSDVKVGTARERHRRDTGCASRSPQTFRAQDPARVPQEERHDLGGLDEGQEGVSRGRRARLRARRGVSWT